MAERHKASEMIEPADAAEPRAWPWRWFAAQSGSREYYAPARAFHLTSQLGALYTGSWVRRGRGLVRRGPSFMRRYAGHFHPDLPEDKVVSYDLGTIAWHIHRSVIARPKTVQQLFQWEVDNSRWFGARVARDLKKIVLNRG